MITKRKLKKAVVVLENSLNAKNGLLNHYYNEYKRYKSFYDYDITAVKMAKDKMKTYEKAYYKQVIENDKLLTEIHKLKEYVNDIEYELESIKYDIKKSQYRDDSEIYTKGVAYDRAYTMVINIDGDELEL